MANNAKQEIIEYNGKFVIKFGNGYVDNEGNWTDDINKAKIVESKEEKVESTELQNIGNGVMKEVNPETVVSKCEIKVNKYSPEEIKWDYINNGVPSYTDPVYVQKYNQFLSNYRPSKLDMKKVAALYAYAFVNHRYEKLKQITSMCYRIGMSTNDKLILEAIDSLEEMKNR